MTKTNYKIIKLAENKTLVIFTSPKRPDCYWHSIATDIYKHMSIGELYFDFLINNGPKNRYFKALYKEGKIEYTSLSEVKNINSYIEEISNKFFSANLNLLDESIMSSFFKTFYKRKLSKISY